MSAKYIPCSKCSVPLNPVFLKNGMCNGCRHPERIVKSMTHLKPILLALLTRLLKQAEELENGDAQDIRELKEIIHRIETESEGA